MVDVNKMLKDLDKFENKYEVVLDREKVLKDLDSQTTRGKNNG